MRSTKSPLVSLVLCVGAFGGARSALADSTQVIDGTLPEGAPDHVLVDFTVPAGTKEIEVRHVNNASENVLDFGVLDANGYRGWGGGTSEPAILGENAASRAYVPGPIAAGTWRVVIGKAKIAKTPATYHLEILYRDTPTLPAQAREPYVASAPLKSEARWYAGDFHVHSKESTDAKPEISAIIAYAKTQNLDFVELSDHNTVTQDDFINALQKGEPNLLLIPGIEFTTYRGHANAIGATKWVDHKIGLNGATVQSAMDQILDQGAAFSINHPALNGNFGAIDLDALCIGCGWNHVVDYPRVTAVEIATNGWRQQLNGLLATRSIGFWDFVLDKGAHAAALGGSDDHSGGTEDGPLKSPIGDPTTMVFAENLSAQAIVEAVKKGRTVVKLQDNNDPMAELTSSVEGSMVGDVLSVRSTTLKAKVTGANGQKLRFVKNGSVVQTVAIGSDPFTTEMVVDAPPTGEDRYRVEVIVTNDAGAEERRTITSHIFLKYGVGTTAPTGDAGGSAGNSGTDPGTTPETGAPAHNSGGEEDGGGCSIREYSAKHGVFSAFIFGAVALLASRARRRSKG